MTEMLGTTVFWISATLVVVGLFAIPALRGVAMLAMGVRVAVRAIEGWVRARSLGVAPERPLELDGLSPGLADLTRQTRYLALELRRHGEDAATWPSTSVDQKPSFWSAFVGVGGFGPQTEATREVWEWLRSIEQLAPADREQLVGLGVDAEPVRELLHGELAPAEQMRALAGLLWSIDERLTGSATPGYRGSSARHPLPGFGLVRRAPSTGADEDEEPSEAELRERRRRWAELLERHGVGISRMAASHTRSRAEKEDLEQDIALALWQALPSFRGESSIKTFAFRVARYCCYRYLRRRGRVQVDGFVDDLGDPSACIESWLNQVDDRVRLERALAQLPAGLESTLALRLEGKSYAEIAAELGISEQNVSVRLTRARQRLEQQLAAA